MVTLKTLTVSVTVMALSYYIFQIHILRLFSDIYGNGCDCFAFSPLIFNKASTLYSENRKSHTNTAFRVFVFTLYKSKGENAKWLHPASMETRFYSSIRHFVQKQSASIKKCIHATLPCIFSELLDSESGLWHTFSLTCTCNYVEDILCQKYV